jgi:hypothetical protein
MFYDLYTRGVWGTVTDERGKPIAGAILKVPVSGSNTKSKRQGRSLPELYLWTLYFMGRLLDLPASIQISS